MSDFLDEKARRFKRMAREIGKQISLRENDWYRASGECVCDVCGLNFFDHPTCDDGIIHVLCNGDQVKL